MISLARGERSRNKNNTNPAFCQGWGAIKGASVGSFFFSPNTQHPTSFKKRPPYAWQALPLKETKDTSRRSGEAWLGHPTAQSWSPSCAVLGSTGAFLAWPKPSPSAACWAPSKGKAHRRHHPQLSSQVLGKSSHSEEVTWAVDLKIKRKREKDWAWLREEPQPIWGFRRAGFWLESAVLILYVSLRFTSWDPFPIFVLSTSREVSLGHNLTPAVFLQWGNGASALLKCRHYREIATELQLFFQNICFASAHRVILGIVH